MLKRRVGLDFWSRETLHWPALLAAVALLGFLATGAEAQPFGGYLVLTGDNTQYIEIPHSPALNPTGAITLEGWVRFRATDCVSLIGKRWTVAYWVGTCNVFRSYLRGSPSLKDGGSFPLNAWTHWAVTSNGTTRRHYLNGILVGEFAEDGPLTTTTDPVRIGSDVDFEFAPDADLDEFRLWNVARTQAQIQSTMNVALNSPQSGLVAVWPLDGDGRDALGNHDGVVVGNPEFVGIGPPPGPWLTTPDQPDFQFKVQITGAAVIPGTQVDQCIIETLCVAGALAGRPEVFIKLIGPRPNGFLWVQISRFTPSQVEVWVEQLSTSELNYYRLPAVGPAETNVSGLQDREAFLP